MKHLFSLNKYFAKYKWHLLLGIVFVSIYRYCSILIPQTLREALDFVFDKVEASKSADPSEMGDFLSLHGGDILKYAGMMMGFALVMGVFMYFMRQTIIVMSRLVEYDLRKEIFSHYQSLDTAFYKRNKTGDLMSRITEDVSKVRMYLGPALLYGINMLALFIIVIFAMFQVSPTLSMYTLLPLPFLSVSIYYVSRIINKKSELIQEQLSKLTSISQEVYSGIRVVKSYVKSNQFGSFFDEESEIFKQKSLDLARVNALFIPLMIVLIGLSTLLTIYIGGVLVSKGEITNGNIAEFIIYVNYLTWPFTSIGWIASLIQQADASQKRINEFLDEKPSIGNTGNKTEIVNGEIVFDNVNFTYPDTGIVALKNVSFKIPGGEKLGIVGLTASGKTTIAELLLRTYDIDSGDIRIDGTSIQDFNLKELREAIGYVPQDVFLFSDTISNNILFGTSGPLDKSVEDMARHVAVHDDIVHFPQQYETMVGERGVSLSGGQKQRISIARALIKDPNIVILDDCLSAVDTETEQKIASFLDTELAGRTSILITHRLSSLQNYKHIIVLDEGKVVEEGSHAQLVQRGGQYAQMLEKQMYEYEH